MADYKRKFRGIVENSWTHLVALVLLQLGYVYDFFYNIGFFLYRGVVGLVRKAREILNFDKLLTLLWKLSIMLDYLLLAWHTLCYATRFIILFISPKDF